jgi:hypothetical protein
VPLQIHILERNSLHLCHLHPNPIPLPILVLLALKILPGAFQAHEKHDTGNYIGTRVTQDLAINISVVNFHTYSYSDIKSFLFRIIPFTLRKILVSELNRHVY